MIKKHWWQMAPIYGLISLLPLLIFPIERSVWSPLLVDVPILASGLQQDLYTTMKMSLLVVLTIWLCVVNRHATWRKQFVYPVIVFISALMISTFCSDVMQTAIFGQFNRSEGLISWLCYAVLFLQIAHMPVRLSLQKVVYATIPFLVINISFMICRALDETSFFGQIGGTLNQENYISAAMAMLVALYMTTRLWSTMQKRVNELLIVLAIVGLVLTKSQIGFLTACLAIIVILLLSAKRLTRKQMLYTFSLYIGLTLCVALLLAQFDKRYWEESFGVIYTYDTHTNEEKLTEKRQDPLNGVIGYEEDHLPVLPAVATTALSSRIYIWEKTWTLIKERPLFGYGMDTLQYHFPHFNIDARAGISTERLIVDKPHSLYLDLLYGGGVVALLLFSWLTWTAIKSLWQRQKQEGIKARDVALFSICIVYLLQGLTNDSTIALTAIYFLALGLIVRPVQKSTK